jgi:site-specific DNA recombinase
MKPIPAGAVIYARLADSRGGTQSLDGQLQRCRELAASDGLKVVAEYVDAGYGGHTLERPGLQALWARLDQGDIAWVITSHISRPSRVITDWLSLLQRCRQAGVRVKSLREAEITAESFGVHPSAARERGNAKSKSTGAIRFVSPADAARQALAR